MADVMELLEARQGEKSNEAFANEMDLRGSTLWRYYNGKSEIDTASREKMIEFFIARGDAEMVGALLAYKTGRKLNSDGLRRLGNCFLSDIQDQTNGKMALVPSV